MSVTRTPLHTRTIKIDGYSRDDGLFDVDARLTDIKHYRMTNWPGGAKDPGEPMHDMVVTMTVDTDGIIRDFKARADAHPHRVCQNGAQNFERLIGLSIGKGFLKAANERIGGVEGCTHIREMLQQMATIAFQSMREARQKTYTGPQAKRPVLLDSCIAWAASGDWVKVRFPGFYTGPDALPADAMDRGSFELMLQQEGYLDTEVKTIAANVVIAEHSHDFDVLAMVMAGEATIACAGEAPRTYRPGDIVRVAAGVVHTEQYGPQGYTFLVGRRHRQAEGASPTPATLTTADR